MTFLNPLPALFWLILLVPIIIFIINNRTSKTLKFSSIHLLTSLKSNQINRIKILDILLLILRILIILFILLIVMRPHKKDSLSNLDNIGDKIINLIFIDDSFSNLYGSINGINQLMITNDLINGISESYPVDSRLKIVCLNRGLIFDGLNDEVSIDNILDYDYNYVDFQKLLGSEYENYHKNIHIISKFNAHSNKEINNFYDKIKNDSSQFNFFFHALPKTSNNQYIKEVKLINDLNQKFSNYEIIVVLYPIIY